MRFVLGSLVLAMCVGVTRGSTLTLNSTIHLVLDGAAPTGTVWLSGPALPAPYNSGVNVYAGVLDWTDANDSTANYYTYCIDVSSVITTGITYKFEVEDLATSGLFSSPVLNAVENLWNDHSLINGVAGNVGTTLDPGIMAEDAAMFQIALWDVIENHFDSSGNPVTSPQLYFNAPYSGLTALEESQAIGWATQAYSEGNYTGPDNFAALVKQDAGQSQGVLFVGVGSLPAAGPTPTPAPATFAGGMALLAGLAVVRRVVGRRGILAIPGW